MKPTETPRYSNLSFIMTPVYLACLAGLVLLLAQPAHAGSCVTANCHDKMLSAKFVHGPVAIEKTAQSGCLLCHVPEGPACTPTKPGKFGFKVNKKELCSTCHSEGTGSMHTDAAGKCVSCHDPHSSQVSDRFLK